MSEPENYCQLSSRNKLGFNTKNLSHQKINRQEKQFLKVTSPRSAKENSPLELSYCDSADCICDKNKIIKP